MPTDDLLLALATTVSARYGTACSLLLRFKMYAADTTRAPRRPTTLQCLLFPTFHCSSTSFASIHDQSTNHKSIKEDVCIKWGEKGKVSIHTSSYSMQIVAQHCGFRVAVLSEEVSLSSALRLSVQLHKVHGARAARETRERRLDVRLVRAAAQRGELRGRRRVADDALGRRVGRHRRRCFGSPEHGSHAKRSAD